MKPLYTHKEKVMKQLAQDYTAIILSGGVCSLLLGFLGEMFHSWLRQVDVCFRQESLVHDCPCLPNQQHTHCSISIK